MPKNACLIIDKGSPYEKGTRILLGECSLEIGRATKSVEPDVSFENFLISRKHCRVDWRDGDWWLVDLGSMHGTSLNGVKLAANNSCRLNNGDRIAMASGAAALRYVEIWEFEKTMDWSSTQPGNMAVAATGEQSAVAVDMDKMELVINAEKVILSAKEWQLFALLYSCRNKAVDYRDIRSAVWPERNWDNSKIPDVGVEEMNVLIYRVRKKLGAYGKALRTIRGRGCILEL